MTGARLFPLVLFALSSGLAAQRDCLLLDINPGSANGLPARHVDVHGTLFFSACDPVHGHGLWKSDGTPAGTLLVKDFFPGSGGGVQPRELIGLGSLLLCVADDSIHGGELWRSDGTTAGTTLLKDINPGNQSQPVYIDPPTELTRFQGRVYFSARDGVRGRELWATDGTAAGTVLVKDIYPGGNSSDSLPTYFSAAGGTLFFFGFMPATGWELWATDGTTTGTRLVKDVWPGAEPTLITHNNYQFNTGVLGERLLFAVPDGTHGMELWISDGTAAGTALLKDINQGSADTYISRNLTQVGGFALFTADDGASGRELWRTDGTTAGTMLVKDIRPGPSGSDPGFMVALGALALFSADDGACGRELWASDGTPAGTVLVRDIWPGAAGGLAAGNLYSGPTRVGSRFAYFTAADGVRGLELWRSDGTPGGTSLVMDIAAGAADSYPEFLTLSGGRLLFRAKDAVNGQEPRVLFPGATAQARGEAWPPSSTASLAAGDPILGGLLQVRGRTGTTNRPFFLLAGTPAPPVRFPGGCPLYLDPARGLTVLHSGSAPVREWGWQAMLPADPALVGLGLGLQAFQAGHPAGFDASAAVLLTLGL